MKIREKDNEIILELFGKSISYPEANEEEIYKWLQIRKNEDGVTLIGIHCPSCNSLMTKHKECDGIKVCLNVKCGKLWTLKNVYFDSVGCKFKHVKEQ